MSTEGSESALNACELTHHVAHPRIERVRPIKKRAPLSKITLPDHDERGLVQLRQLDADCGRLTACWVIQRLHQTIDPISRHQAADRGRIAGQALAIRRRSFSLPSRNPGKTMVARSNG